MAKDKKQPKVTPAKSLFTSGEIFAAREPLTQLMQQKFPIGVSFKLAKLAKTVQEELSVIEELRNALIKELGQDRIGYHDGLAVFHDNLALLV